MSREDGALRGRVEDAEHEARRWLGQHFLVDASVVTDAVEAARLGAGERVLEIGPGTGNLTNEMLKRGARVLAVEKDRNLAEKLREGLCVEYKDAFELVEGDFERALARERRACERAIDAMDARARDCVVDVAVARRGVA